MTRLTTETRRANGDSGATPGEGGATPDESGTRITPFEVAVVVPAAGQATTYLMFEAHSVTLEGATLIGGLLLEEGEEVTLELRLPDRPAVRARARVVAIDTSAAGKDAALRVEFVNLSDGDRQRLSRRVAGAQSTAS